MIGRILEFMTPVVAGLGAASQWKSRMLQNAQLLFSNKVADLQTIVYGQSANQAHLHSRSDKDYTPHSCFVHLTDNLL